MELTSTLTLLKNCRDCSLCDSRTQVVLPYIANPYKLFIVGEAPGRDEDTQGEPFVGRSGKYFFNLLKEVGISREECYITNVVKCRPPNNRTPLPVEISSCSQWLDNELITFKPTIILSLGKIPTEKLLGRKVTMQSVRGKLEGNVFPIYHPASSMRNTKLKELTRKDLALVAQWIEQDTSNVKVAGSNPARGANEG